MCLTMPYGLRRERTEFDLLLRLYERILSMDPDRDRETDPDHSGILPMDPARDRETDRDADIPEDSPGHPDPTERAGVLFDRYGDSILRLALSYLHNRADAEDVLQDTLIQYLRTAPELEGPAHEKAWLLRVAANLSKNRLRYNRVRQADEIREELLGREREDLAFVWEAVQTLPPRHREVIHLYYQEGYATREIAEILGRRESTVRSDLKRGRDRLKTVLKEAYDFG